MVVRLSRWLMVLVCYVLMLLHSHALHGNEADMEVIIDNRTVLFAGISDAAVKKIAKANNFRDPDKWPVQGGTGHRNYILPEGILKRYKDHPEWKLSALHEFQIVFDTFGQERLVVFYRKESQVLIIVYYTIETR